MLSGHAFVVRGKNETIEAVFAMLAQEGIERQKNPDLYVRRYGAFSIDDARELTSRATLKGVEGRRVFVLVVDSMSVEAQNALLKTLEEPPGGALFVFVHPAPETLLPTVRSRVQILEVPGARPALQALDIEAFLKAKPAVRLDLLQVLLDKGEGDQRDMGAILAFLGNLEHALAHKPTALHAVYRARNYIGDRGALVKPLLEQVALLV